MPAQLDNGGQFPLFVEHTADRRGCLFVHTEHRSTMRRRTGTGKRNAADAHLGSAASSFPTPPRRWRHLAVPPGLGKPCSPELHAVNLRLHPLRLQVATSCPDNFSVLYVPAKIAKGLEADRDGLLTLGTRAVLARDQLTWDARTCAAQRLIILQKNTAAPAPPRRSGPRPRPCRPIQPRSWFKAPRSGSAVRHHVFHRLRFRAHEGVA